MLILLWATSGLAAVSAGDFGIGMGVGALTGVVGKLMVNDWSGIQFSAGGDLGQIGDFGLTADYVINTQPLNNPADGYTARLHFGLGFSLSTNTTSRLGLNIFGTRVLGLPVSMSQLTVCPLIFSLKQPQHCISFKIYRGGLMANLGYGITSKTVIYKQSNRRSANSGQGYVISGAHHCAQIHYCAMVFLPYSS